MFKRSSGVLAHVTSLPSPHGVGTMGKTARDFVDFLAAAHQTYWQVLPLGHTGFGDSPYQCFSAAAGNPYLIDMDLLVEDGLLTADEVRQGDFDASPDTADFEQLADTRWPLFRKAYSRVTPEMREEIAVFTEKTANGCRIMRCSWRSRRRNTITCRSTCGRTRMCATASLQHSKK